MASQRGRKNSHEPGYNSDFPPCSLYRWIDHCDALLQMWCHLRRDYRHQRHLLKSSQVYQAWQVVYTFSEQGTPSLYLRRSCLFLSTRSRVASVGLYVACGSRCFLSLYWCSWESSAYPARCSCTICWCYRCRKVGYPLTFRIIRHQSNIHHQRQKHPIYWAFLGPGMLGYHKMTVPPSYFCLMNEESHLRPSQLIWPSRSRPIWYDHQSQS